MVVFDASVALKLFVDEPLTELAHSLLEKYGVFIAPDVIRIEVSSGITRKVRKREMAIDTAYETLQEWSDFLATDSVRLIPSEELIKDSERLSIDLRHPLPDCLYLAAANQRKLPLVTADQPFIDSLGKGFRHVRHLSSFTT